MPAHRHKPSALEPGLSAAWPRPAGPARSSGFADDEAGRQQDLFRCAGRIRDPAKQQVRRRRTDLRGLRGDAAERRNRGAAFVDIVEADHGEIGPGTSAEALQATQTEARQGARSDRVGKAGSAANQRCCGRISSTSVRNRQEFRYWIRSIWFSLRARMKVGSGMKCTASRKCGAFPPSGEIVHSRKFRIAAAVAASGCCAETIAYS